MSASPAAGHRRRWVDPRLLIGIGLVVGSVAGVVGLVAAVDTRTVVVAAPSALTAGERVERDDLLERSVGLDDSAGLYLRLDEVPDEGLTMVRTVPEGELIPRSAVGDPETLQHTSLIVDSAVRLGSATRAGSTVDLWATAAEAGGEGAAAPIVLVADATVVRVLQGEGLMPGSSSSTVELLVPRSQVARVLQAQAAGDALAVVAAGRTSPGD